MRYKLRTIDVWDTLLRRDCHPECIKLATARHVLLGWPDHLRPDFQEHWALYRARIDAERFLAEAARSEGQDDEYEIAAVLHQWLLAVFCRPFDTALPCRLAEFELQVEIARSFKDPDIEDFLQAYPAEHNYFLSDFYMNSSMLGRLLEEKGLDALVCEGIASCEIGLNKRSGRLFQHVHSLHGIFPKEHVHVGDNRWSDIEAAEKSGVTAVHYLPATSHAERLARERLFSSREALFEHIRALCADEALQVSQGMSAKQAAAFRLGADAAPLFIGFALWIAEQALVKKLDQLHFLTREGEFFHQVFTALFPQQTFFGHTLPPSNILAVSRLSTFVSSLREVTIGEMSRIWDLFKEQNVAGMFVTLGININNFKDILDQLELKPEDVIEIPQQNSALNKLFDTPEFVNALQNSIARQQSLLCDYLIQNGWQSEVKIGVVDIGWRGTIQDNLALVMSETNLHGMYLGLRRFVNPQPDNVSKSAYGPNENISSNANDLFEVFAALEMLCMSAGGSVVGYRRTPDQILPCRQVLGDENAAYDQFTRYFQQGILLAAKHWRLYIERYVVSASELQNTALRVWATLRSTPSVDLAELFIKTPQHDVFGFGDFFNRNQAPSLTAILLAPLVKERRRQLIEFIRRVQWSAAIQHINGLSRFHRWTLVFTFRFANQVRRLRMKVQCFRNRDDAKM
ncbi:HAD family hydrolase [Nitrosomonas sp. Nm34]|uniref:HAD family hydrolase n=1 Tax=Nitrosomonas sp. Nm34 TaxID=1881055 RepID=UPI0008E3BDEE|nr:HAD family hydrolase [Nitrosomonas sp. Nm34]SFI40180.1 hypothetical protein SAMN05428978_100889 [Nitrosomonas sp. Nm34]